MALTSNNISYTGLVDKYIGTAYDQMSTLYANLDALLLIALGIEEGDFQTIIDMADDIQKAIDDIAQFNDTYYGALAEEPLTKPSGAPTISGDLYYNTTDSQLYVYSTDGWEGTGIVDKTIEQFVITADQATQVPLSIDLQFPYKVGSNNAFVFVNREHYFSLSVDDPPVGTSQGTYLESNNKQITFPNGLNEDDLVVIGVNTEVSTVSHLVDVNEWVTVTGTPSQQVIELPQDMIYVPNSNNIDIYVGDTRELQLTTIDYVETDPLTVTFNSPIGSLGTDIVVRVGQIISNVPQVPYTIFQETQPDPDLYVQGQQWWDTDRGRMFILYSDVDTNQWLSITGEQEILLDGGSVSPTVPDPIQVRETLVQELEPNPDSYSEGALWFKSSTGEMFFLYDDPTVDEQHWVKVST